MSITRNLNAAKPSYVAKTTETAKRCWQNCTAPRILTYSDLIQSHLQDENICCTKVFCAKLGLLRFAWGK